MVVGCSSTTTSATTGSGGSATSKPDGSVTSSCEPDPSSEPAPSSAVTSASSMRSPGSVSSASLTGSAATSVPSSSVSAATRTPPSPVTTVTSEAKPETVVPPAVSTRKLPADLCEFSAQQATFELITTSMRSEPENCSPAENADGAPVWGATYGNRQTSASVIQVTEAQWLSYGVSAGPANVVVTRLTAIGDESALRRSATRELQSDGRHRYGTNPEVWFRLGSHYFKVEVTPDRDDSTDQHDAAAIAGERLLAAGLAKALK